MGAVDGLHRMTAPAGRDRRPSTVAVASTALALAALLAVACSPGAAQSQVPEGFTRFEHPRYSFVYPAGWEILDDAEHRDATSEMEMLGEGREGFRPELRVYRTEGLAESYTTEDFVFQFNTLSNLRMRERRLVADEPFTVDGAVEARLVESGYRSSLLGDDVRMRQFDLVVLAASGQLIDLRVGGREGALDERQLHTIIDSFRLRA